MAGEDKTAPLPKPRKEAAAESSLFRNVFIQGKLAKTRSFFMVSAIGTMATLYAARASTNVVLQAGFSAGGVLLAFFLLEVWRIYAASKKQNSTSQDAVYPYPIPGSLSELWVQFQALHHNTGFYFKASGKLCSRSHPLSPGNLWIEYLQEHTSSCHDLRDMEFLAKYLQYKELYDKRFIIKVQYTHGRPTDFSRETQKLGQGDLAAYQALLQQKKACLKNMAKILSEQYAPNVDHMVTGPQSLLALWQRFSHAQKHKLVLGYDSAGISLKCDSGKTVEYKKIGNSYELFAGGKKNSEVAAQWTHYVLVSKSQCANFDEIVNIFENRLKEQRLLDELAKIDGEKEAQKWAGEVVNELRKNGYPLISCMSKGMQRIKDIQEVLYKEWLHVLGSVIERPKAEVLSEATASPENQPALVAAAAAGSEGGAKRSDKKNAGEPLLTAAIAPSPQLYASRRLAFFERNSQTALGVAGSASLLASIGMGICEATNSPSLAARWTMGIGVAGCLLLLLAAATFSAKQRRDAQFRIR